MKKEVLITVTGLLYTGSGEDERDYIDVITPGMCYRRDGDYYLFYDEQMEGFDEPVRNRVHISSDRVTISKKGIVTAEMLFEVKKHTQTWYSTPFGRLELSIYTSRISVTGTPGQIEVDIRYRLLLNGGQVNHCFVKILVQEKGKESGFRLLPEEGI